MKDRENKARRTTGTVAADYIPGYQTPSQRPVISAPNQRVELTDDLALDLKRNTIHA
jgi:hypothetical protein